MYYTLKMNFGGSVRINPLGLVVLTVVALIIIYFNFGRNSVGNQAQSHQSISMKALLAVSIEMAKRGGTEVKRIREQIDIGEKSKGKTVEGANNPVTDGDMLSHRAMYYGLLKAFPGLNVISEEDDPQPVNMDKVKMAHFSDPEVDKIVIEDSIVPLDEIDVWIDPLDATQEYTENLLQYVTTMVCVAVKGKAVIGVIHKPFEDKTAWGWAGPDYISKDVQEDLPKDPLAHKDMSKAKIIVSRSHAGKVHDVAATAFGDGVKVTPAGGAGYKAWEVARGVQDAYVHVTLIKKWDICPGNALLKALKGRMTDLAGLDVDYSGKPAQVRAEGGVLATLHDHESFLAKLKPALDIH